MGYEKCGEKCEVYTRVVGFYRPVQQFNKGKQKEFNDRREFNMGGNILDTNRYYMNIAKKAAQKSTCLKRKVGAVLAKSESINTIIEGWNGPPDECEQCKNVGCARENIKSGTQHEICRAIHAEQRVLIKTYENKLEINKDDILYITCSPCVICAKLLIMAGIKHIIYLEDYPDKLANIMLKEAEVKVEKACCNVKI